jgi:uncharacterized paraquat-inducible protein A
MTRCQSCDGILTKNEEACYRCGDPVPENAKSAGTFSLLLVAAGLIVSIGFTAYSFL